LQNSLFKVSYPYPAIAYHAFDSGGVERVEAVHECDADMDFSHLSGHRISDVILGLVKTGRKLGIYFFACLDDRLGLN
jgi:hypothetical protein